MATVWQRASVLLRDNGGNIAKIFLQVAIAASDPGSGAVHALQLALQALTLATSPRAETGGTAGPSGTVPGASDYGSVEDRAVLTFAAADGSTMQFDIPGPGAIFKSDNITVDPANTDVAALITWIQANTVSKYNQALTFVKGLRTSKKEMKV
jgi:hypothetical protein